MSDASLLPLGLVFGTGSLWVGVVGPHSPWKE